MSRGQEQATERNSAPRGSRDRDDVTCKSLLKRLNASVNQTGGDRWCQLEQQSTQVDSGELEGNWRLS
jgi:hypothetical protein